MNTVNVNEDDQSVFPLLAFLWGCAHSLTVLSGTGWIQNLQTGEISWSTVAECAVLISALLTIVRPDKVSLLLTNDAEMRALNKSWRGEDGATNVLSFPLDAPQGTAGPEVLGDVVLAYETVVREAAERGIATGQHAAHLVVHALLHLMGYDHISDQEAAIMEDLEVRILGSLGLPNPYSLQSPTDGEGQ